MQTANNSITLDAAVGPSSSPRHRRLQLSHYYAKSNININSTPAKSTSTTNEVILGLRNDARYREIMYQQFNILGTTRDPAREDKVALQIFSMFQLEGALFYRMERNGTTRVRLDDEEALKRITRHLKRRTESTHIWLGKSILPTSRSTMGMTKVSNHQEYSCDFQAEEKKQDDDPMDLEIGSSSSAAFSNDHRSVHSCSTGTGQHAHQHVPESNLSSLDSHDENSSLGMIPNDRTILSLNDEYYKEIMWRHYRMLGKTRDSDREIQIGNDIFNIFRQQMGKTGRFFKRAQYQDFEVDDETALAKIIADIRRRMKNYPKWSGSPQKLVVKAQSSTGVSAPVGKMPPSSPRQLRREARTEPSALRNGHDDSKTVRKRPTRSSTSSDPAPRNIPKTSRDDIILCLNNEKYKEVMMRYYTILGNKQGGGKFKEENVVKQIFQSLKTSMGKGGRFFTSTGNVLHPVDDESAMKTISRDIKRRNEVIHHWLTHGSNDECRVEPLSHSNTASVSSPIAQHHAWRDQLSASPIEVLGNLDFSAPSPQQSNEYPVAQLTSEPSLLKSTSCPSLRKSVGANEPYQLCSFGEKAIEEYFQQVGERILLNALQDGIDLGWTKPSIEACNHIFTDATSTSQGRLSVRRHPERLSENAGSNIPTSSGHNNSSFLRHFQSNEARLVELQSINNDMEGSELSAIRLSSTIKRVKVGSKDRVLCMVVNCEKHAQTRCSGCCTTHFRLLSSTTSIVKKQQLPAATKAEVDSISGDVLKSGVQGEDGFMDKECRELSFINQIHNVPVSGKESTNAEPFRHNTPTFSSTQQLISDSVSKTSASRSMITISPITTKQSGNLFSDLGKSTQNPSLDCLDCPGNEASVRKRTHSPIGVQAVNILPPIACADGHSAFSPTRIVRPPLYHQLYRPSEASPKRVHFPGLRSASAGPIVRNGCCKAEQRHTMSSCLSSTKGFEARNNCQRRMHDGHERTSAGNDVPNTRKSKRILQSMSAIEDLDGTHSLPRSHVDQSKSAICHCPICSKGNLNVQGMYAHYGRAHIGALPWEEVTFSCPFCSTTSVFDSFRDLEAHVNAKHPGCEVVGPHPSKLPTSASPNNARELRVRKAAPDGINSAPRQQQLHAKDSKAIATKQPIRSWSKLEYPQYNSKDTPIALVDEQRRLQEEIVEGAREQRMKLCRNEAEAESKLFEEERLAYLRGIRERTRLADGERIEKQKFTEKADQLMMLYQYENRNKKRSREEVEFDKLCARSVIFTNETTRLATREGKSCPDDHCQFCVTDNVATEDRKKDLHSKNQSPVRVLLPSFRIVDDIFSLHAGGTTTVGVREDPSVASKEIKNAKSRRDVSTAKRLKIEEDKLLMLKSTTQCLEFIKKYNAGMICNAWGGARKEGKYKKRKTIG